MGHLLVAESLTLNVPKVGVFYLDSAGKPEAFGGLPSLAEIRGLGLSRRSSMSFQLRFNRTYTDQKFLPSFNCPISTLVPEIPTAPKKSGMNSAAAGTCGAISWIHFDVSCLLVTINEPKLSCRCSPPPIHRVTQPELSLQISRCPSPSSVR
jgi:hypothetical protein